MPIPTPAAVLMPLVSLSAGAVLDAVVDGVDELGLDAEELGIEVAVGVGMSEGAMDVVGAAGPFADHVFGVALGAFSTVKGGELE